MVDILVGQEGRLEALEVDRLGCQLLMMPGQGTGMDGWMGGAAGVTVGDQHHEIQLIDGEDQGERMDPEKRNLIIIKALDIH